MLSLPNIQQEDYCQLLTKFEKDIQLFPNLAPYVKNVVVLTQNKEAQIILVQKYLAREQLICEKIQEIEHTRQQTAQIKLFCEQKETANIQQQGQIVDLIVEKELSTLESCENIKANQKSIQSLLQSEQREIETKITQSEEKIRISEQQKLEVYARHNQLVVQYNSLK